MTATPLGSKSLTFLVTTVMTQRRRRDQTIRGLRLETGGVYSAVSTPATDSSAGLIYVVPRLTTPRIEQARAQASNAAGNVDS